MGWENIFGDSWLKQWSDIGDHQVLQLAGRKIGIYSSLKRPAVFKTGERLWIEDKDALF